MFSPPKRIIMTALLLCLSLSSAANAAGELNSLFSRLEQAGWGEQKQTVKQSLNEKILYENQAILILPDRNGLEPQATINYLFTRETGELYSLAWFNLIPIKNIEAAQKLENILEQSLKAKFGQPVYTSADADEVTAREKAKARAEEVEQTLAEKAEYDEAYQKAKAEKGGELSGKDLKDIKTSGGKSIIDFIPVIFYSKTSLWDTDDFLISSKLLCSTDGSCYQHLNFIPNKPVKNEVTDLKKPKPFSYTSIDRDQDAVTRYNMTIRAK